MAEPTSVRPTGPDSRGTDQVALPRRQIGKARAQTAYSQALAGDQIRRDDTVNLSRSVRDSRNSAAAATKMRALFETDGIVSTAITNYIAMMRTDYRIKAYYTATEEFSRDAVVAAEAVLASLASDWDYTKGYSDKRGLEGLIETMRLETLLTGGVGLELVLDKYRLPRDMHVFPYDSVTWVSKGEGRKVPTQKNAQGGDDIVLDLPTIFIAESLKSAQRKYALPLMHSGLSRVFHYDTFLEDAWRVITRAGMSRLVVSLNYDMVVASAPPEIKGDPNKLSSYLDDVRVAHQDALSSLNPEDALVVYSTAEVEALRTTGEKAEIAQLIDQLSGLAASALKSSPTMLGLRLGGSQNTSSVEALLSTKTAAMLQQPVEEVLSRALTLAVRLYGVDAYVELEFDPVELRPDLELEPHKVMRQSRVLEQLSLGMKTDDEANSEIGNPSLPQDYVKLSGTGFMKKGAAASGIDGEGTMPANAANSRNRQVAPQTPSSAGGKDNAQRP
jgi:hypothetical protein